MNVKPFLIVFLLLSAYVNASSVDTSGDEIKLNTAGIERLKVRNDGKFIFNPNSSYRLTLFPFNANDGAHFMAENAPMKLGTYDQKPLKFYTSNQDRLVIDENGRVGMGTSSPASPLHIEGNSGSGLFKFDFTDKFSVMRMESEDQFIISYNENHTVVPRQLAMKSRHTQGTIGLYTAEIERLRITSDGKVGIGTNSPSKKLSVAGTIESTKDHGDEGGEFLLRAESGYSKQFAIDNKQDRFRIIRANDGTGASGSELVTVKSSGQVGIATGTNIPTAAKLAVEGKIYAREVVVNQDSWPDYVFEKDYDLLPLEAVEKHIKDHKHLPEVPPASEVEANGVGVGEMSKILLQKVEELTLYTIQLKKQNEVQEQLLQKMEDRLKELEGQR